MVHLRSETIPAGRGPHDHPASATTREFITPAPAVRCVRGGRCRDDTLRKREEARGAPQPVDPNTYAPFDPQSGAPRVWYSRSDEDAWIVTQGEEKRGRIDF